MWTLYIGMRAKTDTWFSTPKYSKIPKIDSSLKISFQSQFKLTFEWSFTWYYINRVASICTVELINDSDSNRTSEWTLKPFYAVNLVLRVGFSAAVPAWIDFNWIQSLFHPWEMVRPVNIGESHHVTHRLTDWLFQH